MVLRSVVVTGGTGFLGSAICRAVEEKSEGECKVFALDVRPPNGTHKLPASVSFVQADIMSIDNIYGLFEKIKPQVVIHSAGLVPQLALRYSRKESRNTWDVNVNGTKNVLDAARKAGVEAFVYTSSVAVVTDDLSTQFPNVDERWPACYSSLPYGESKAAAEALVLESTSASLASCALRPSPIFGPGDYLVLPRVHAMIARGETSVVIGRDYRLWDMTFVDNIADAHVLAAQNLVSSQTAAGEAFFIQNNEPIPFRDFCLAIWAFFGHVPRYEIHIPVFVALAFGFVADLVSWVTGRSFTLGYGAVQEFCCTRYANGQKAKAILGYEPRVGLDEAVRISCEEHARETGVSLPSPVKR